MRTCFVVSLLLFAQLQCHHAMKNLISFAICEIVDKHFASDASDFAFVFNKNSTTDLFDKTLQHYKQFKPYKIEMTSGVDRLKVNQPTVFIFNSITEFFAFDNKTDYAIQRDNIRMKSLVYCHNATADEIESKFRQAQEKEELGWKYVRGSNNGFQLMSFLIEENNKISLNALAMFSQVKCGLIHLVEINTFSNAMVKWEKEIFFTPDINNFHGCTLNIVIQKDPPVCYCKRNKDGTPEPSGYAVSTVEAFSKSLNFNIAYGFCDNYDVTHMDLELRMLFSFNQLDFMNNVGFPFINDHYVVAVPPGEEYTSLEKLFLPFDFHVWILFLVVFIVAYFFVIFLKLFSDPEVAKFIIGRDVNAPSLNIFSIFMGIGMVKLPDKNFPRFLLMSFILYCLIMR